jgi:hypothetical protein
MLNYNLSQMTVVQVAAADEGDDFSAPVLGTNDGFGLSFESTQTAYHSGIAAEALATCGLGGTLAQVGDPSRVRYKPIEFIAQQAVDFLVWHQNDIGSYVGSFYYTPNTNQPDGSTSAWMYGGLYAMATSPLAARGVYVNNMVRARIGLFLRASIHATPSGVAPSRPYGTGGFTYTPAMGGYSYQLSAAPLLAMAMMGWNNPLWEGNTALIPNDAGITITTRGQAYITYRQTFDYIGDDFNGTGGADANGWSLGQWQGGAGGYDRTDDQFNLYTIQWVARGLAAVGATCAGGTEAQDANGACTDGNDWRHQYSVLLVRRQTVAPGGGAWLLAGYNAISGNAINAMDAPMRNALAIATLHLSQ